MPKGGGVRSRQKEGNSYRLAFPPPLTVGFAGGALLSKVGLGAVVGLCLGKSA